jgi:hypothetical protein
LAAWRSHNAKASSAWRQTAAIGRQRDGDVAETPRAEAESARAQVGIVGRLAPGLAHAGLKFRGLIGDQA